MEHRNINQPCRQSRELCKSKSLFSKNEIETNSNCTVERNIFAIIGIGMN